MPSPLPGMNPWLEQKDVWHDFHQTFIAALRAAIAPQVRPAYVTKIDENVYIHPLSEEQRLLLGRPDVAVLNGGVESVETSTKVVHEPIAYGQLLPTEDRLTESFLEIRDAQYRDLITVIELLSPANKETGPDREQYLAKRRVLLSANVHLVEIDLLRGGARMPVDTLPHCDYAVLVSRSHERPRVGIWPLKLKEPLPTIPIPLKPEDPDAEVDLQQLLHEQFDAAGYADYIYSGTPRPPLHPHDEAWAKEFLDKAN